MYILKRNVGEALLIGKDIRIVVHSAHGSYAKIGIEAPKHIKVTAVDEQEKSDKSASATIVDP